MKRTLLLINGSLRAGSVNAAVLKTVQQVADRHVMTVLYGGMSSLPHFNPDEDREPLNGFVVALRDQIKQANALMFCTPEYAGALPSSFKNLLDWTVGGTEISGKPAGWINAASPAAPAGGEDAYASLQKILGYVGARIVEAACVRVPLSRQSIDMDGSVLMPDARLKIAAAMNSLLEAISD